jgi:hypothetical protein
MSRATMALPDTYAPSGVLDLSKDRAVMIGVNVAAAVALLPAGVLVLGFVAAFRPEAASGSIQVGGFGALLVLVVLAAVIALVVVTHEAVHGAGFWLVTGARPKFGIRVPYAYAAAPNWYIPRNQYLPIALAPFVLLTLGGLALVLIVPIAAVPALALGITLNAVGAIGDLIAAVWLLTRARSSLVRDLGVSMMVYRRAGPQRARAETREARNA